MKKEHINLVWQSLENFERANITFNDFLEQLGLALESASVAEGMLIGEATRNLEYALVNGSDQDVKRVMENLRTNVLKELQDTKPSAVAAYKEAPIACNT
jgi:hypothetical protein